MNVSDDDANTNPRMRPVPPGQVQDIINLTVQPIQVNVTQVADPQVLKLLADLLVAVQESAADRAKLTEVTNDIRNHAEALKRAVDAAKPQTP